MYLRDILRRSARNLKSAKARTLLTAFAIAVGTFALTLTLAASNGAEAFVKNIISDNFDPAELIVAADKTVISGARGDAEPKEYDESFGVSSSNAGASIQVKRLTDKDIEKIEGLDGVESVRQVIDLNLQYITREGEGRYVATTQALSPSQNPTLLAGTLTKPLKEKTLLLPDAYVKSLGFKNAKAAIGQSITVAVRKPLTEQTIANALVQAGPSAAGNAQEIATSTDPGSVTEEFTIAGVMEKPTSSQPGTELYLFMNPEDIARLNDISTEGTDDYRKYLYSYVRVKNGENQEKLMAVQKELEGQGYYSQSVEETQEFLTQIIDILRGIVAAFGAIAVIASVFGIINTMYISVLQRTREIGLMKALGMRRKDIGRLFRFEAAWIGFLGGVIGSAAAILTGTLLNPWITETLSLEKGERLLIFDYTQVAILIAILIVISIIAGWLPSRKATKLDPIEALRTE